MTDSRVKVNKVHKKSCSVPNCDGRAERYHKFPSDEAVKRKWVETCNITKPVNCNNYVCSAHFAEEDYSCLKPKRLRRNVIPSRNLTQNELDFEEFEPEKEALDIQTERNAEHSGFVEVDVPSHNAEENASAGVIISQSKKIGNAATNVIMKCCVPQCHTKSSNKRLFHSFPKLKKTYYEWFAACNLSQPVKHPLYVCNSHFRKEDYLNLNSSKLVLKSDAVPSLNMPRKPKFKVVIKEDNSKEELSFTNAKVNQDKEKVTTIIYVPKNCKSVITPKSGQVKVVKTQDNRNNSIKKDVSRVLQNHNPMRIETMQQKDTMKTQSNCSTKNQSNVSTKNQSNVQVQKKMYVDEEDHGTFDDDIDISSEYSNDDLNFHKTNNNVMTVRKETISSAGKKPGKTSVTQKFPTNDQVKKNVSAITMCADCGQYTSIDDEDLANTDKNSETLAAEALLELQEVNPSNEDEKTVLTKKGIEICDRIFHNKKFSLLGLLNSDLELMAFTGINLSLLDRLTKAVVIAEGTKSTAKAIHTPRERIVLCLCKLRTNITFRSLAAIFGLSKIICSSYFFSMVRMLAGILNHTIHWSKTEELLKNLPKAFQSFKQTRVVLNCTETEIDKKRCPKCLKKQLDKNKTYESVKFVLGVAPNGLIIFKSKTFDAQADDTSVFTQTALLSNLDPLKEAIMTDNTLNIEAECVERNITLIKAPKLNKNKQYTASDVELIKNVCAARVHVDRSIMRFKMYKILQMKISWRILPYLDDICTIVTGIINLKNPIPPDEARLALRGLNA